MNNFKTTIGIEIHTVVNSLTKMFSNSKSCHNDPVNTNVNEIDLALPGSLPSVNETVIKKAIQLAYALNMKINSNLTFDRKNYFYHDLPKGFQITQQFFPIGKNGFIEITDQKGNIKRINIERIHIEEDTAKQQIINGKICLDFNRCGMPLIEIVTAPEINNEYEATEYLKQIKRILNFTNVSDAKMEEGSLRADINISHNLYGEEKLGNKVEIKNINSLSNINKAILFEKNRQISNLLLGHKIVQQTMKWDDQINQCVFMREKLNEVDYHYFTEPNILTIKLTDDFISDAIKEISILPVNAKQNLRNIGFDDKIIEQLLDDFNLFKLISDLCLNLTSQEITTWFIVELTSLSKKNNKQIYQLDRRIIINIIEMIKLLRDGEINSKQAKIILSEIYTTQKDSLVLINELGFIQIKDEEIISKYIKKYIEDNQSMMSQYKERPERVEKFLLGLLMKETNGQANPNISMQIVKKLLNLKKE